MSYTNADGLYVITSDVGGVAVSHGTTGEVARRSMVVDIPDFRLISNTFSTNNLRSKWARIPKNAMIVDANLIMTTAATSAGAATLDIGTYDGNGNTVDADGIDAAIALSAINAVGEVVQCDGAQVNGTVTVGTSDVFIGLTYGTAAYTAGAGKLIIDYQTY